MANGTDPILSRAVARWLARFGQALRNMWMPTGQPGLWFIAGSFAQCRINSKYLALQIKALGEGLMPAPAARAPAARRAHVS